MDVVDEILAQWRKERPDMDPSPIAVFGRLRRTADLARARLEALLAPYGLNRQTFGILATLRRGGAPYRQTPTDLAASQLATSGAITGRLDALERPGLIRRVPSPTDRRVTHVELTEKGRQLIDVIMDEHVAEEESMLGELSASDRAALAGLLSALEASIVTSNRPRRGEPPPRVAELGIS